MAVMTTLPETYGNRFLEPGSRSAALYERALRVLPGGNTRTTIFSAPFPPYLVSGEGARITDADGQVRLDYLNNYTALMHGHAHPEIVYAAQAQIARGSAMAGPTEFEVELAEILSERVPAIEQIRFTNSGSEAVMAAMKAARAYTGRPKIAKFEGCYHGTYDPAEVSVNPHLAAAGEADAPRSVAEHAGLAPGTVEGVVVLPFNDREAVARIVEHEAANLAAIIVDPLANNAGFLDPAPGFLQFLRELTQRHGILLICDEIICFRIAYEGASGHFGVKPDIVTLGKIIGGGLPVGAVGGSAEVMSVFDPSSGKPRVPHGGTFNANPVTMAAGVVSMRLWTREAIGRMTQMGDDLRQRSNWVLDEAGLPFKLTGQASLFRIMPKATQADFRSGVPDAHGEGQRRELFLRLMGQGIMISQTGLGCLSTVMTDEDATSFVEGLRVSANAMTA